MLSKTIILSGIIALFSTVYISAQDSNTVNKFYNNFLSSNNYDTLNSGKLKNSNYISLNKAIILGLQNNPRLKSKNLEISAFQAAALQAGLYPNPEVGVELENFLGSGYFNGFNASENTFLITQDFVLGGRLKNAEKLQLINSNIARWELEKERLNLISGIRKSFTIISSFQHQNNLNKKLLQISRDFLKNLERRIKAGKVSPAESSRASLITTSLEIQIQNTKMQLSSEMTRLKALLGKPNLEFSSVENICNLKYNIPQLDELTALIIQSPTLAQFKTETKRFKAAVELERSKVIPDLSVSFGLRRISETRDNVLVFGVSLPLPLFNNNRGNIQKAIIRKNQTEYNFSSSLNQTKAKLNSLYNNIKAYDGMLKKLEEESIPKAKNAFKIISEGNLVGRFTVLDVLDAQRSLFELESQYVSAVAEYNRNIIDLEELTLTNFNFEFKARTLNNE
ncbi:cobalt-zinc-cadmium resistance protein CzcC precursor [bacterium BMS3Abin04]|nr:cobalt-zinc-cadmium resistance protein CzcC precursor [bacterium BMS3Abin04]